jgi:alkyl hydroperoxide reductase subunit F
MLEDSLKAQLKAYLVNLRQPIELVASLDAGPKSQEMLALLTDIVAQSDRVTLRQDGTDSRKPSFASAPLDAQARVQFAGLPMGHEFTSLVLALLWSGGHPPKVEQGVIDQIVALEGDYRFETYFSLSCQNCPDVVQALTLMSVLNPRIQHVAIDGALFQGEVEARKIMAVPTVLLNGEPFAQGRMSLEQIVAKLDSGAEARAAEALSTKSEFDVLVVGGDPAGAAAAVYAARKGIRTGLMAERFGGSPPWLDTYAATSPAEFFAVTSETYFVSPAQFETDFAALKPLFDAFFDPKKASN